MKYLLNLIIILGILLLVSCSGNSSKEDKPAINMEISLNETLDKEAVKLNSEEDVVFYNMFSPVDLNKVIDEKKSYFNSAYISSLNNITKYTTSHQIALNIGIYGADLTYLWMFEQNQQALSYLTAIQHLTKKLGIPDNFVAFTIESVEKNAGNIDTLVAIARNAYKTTDRYLKDGEREDAATLILIGGWIETLHIALNMYTKPESQLAGKIISQKYSLSSLINMVQNNQKDIVMSEYLLLMKKLNDEFKVLESMLKPEDIEIDTITKHISIKNTSNLNIDPQKFTNIKNITADIRNHIIQ